MTMPIPDGSVVITPAQMYAELREMRGSVDRLANTIDPALNDIRGDVTTLYQAKADGERERTTLATRLTVLETKLRVVWALIGLTIAGVASVATVIAVVLHH